MTENADTVLPGMNLENIFSQWLGTNRYLSLLESRTCGVSSMGDEDSRSRHLGD